jgi:hypothetical protein
VDKVIDPASPALDALWNAEWKKNLLDAALAKVKRPLDPQKCQFLDLHVNKGWMPETVAASYGIYVDPVYLAKHRTTGRIGNSTRDGRNSIPASVRN